MKWKWNNIFFLLVGAQKTFIFQFIFFFSSPLRFRFFDCTRRGAATRAIIFPCVHVYIVKHLRWCKKKRRRKISLGKWKVLSNKLMVAINGMASQPLLLCHFLCLFSVTSVAFIRWRKKRNECLFIYLYVYLIECDNNNTHN